MNQRRPLLLLHGALGADEQFSGLRPLLEGRFDLRSLNFPGHGGEPFPEGPFSIADFAEHLHEWIDREGLAGIDIFGYSMGGYVALFLARHAPDRVGRIFTLATKFAWDPATAARETTMLNPAVIEEKVPKFASQLKSRHAPNDWTEVLARTAVMMTSLGDRNELPIEELAGVEHRVQIAVGDKDQMVTIEESMGAYRKLPNGRFLVMPATQHPIEKVPLNRLAREIEDFFVD